MTELLGVVSDGVVHLLRQEIRLAQTEAKNSLEELRAQVRRAAPRFAVALVIGVAAAVAATIGAIRLLADFVLNGQLWLAAFIVAATLALVAMGVVRAATRAFAPINVLPLTADSLREASTWIKHPMQPASRALTHSALSAATHRPRSNGKSR
ncbi:MAG: phage holin family protein [Gemmatimonadaceae bacterium]